MGLLAVLLASCGGTTSGTSVITVRDTWLHPVSPAVASGGATVTAPALTTSAIYMTITNTGNQRDRLIGATTDAATAIELHQTKLVGNVAQMQRVQALDFPAHGEVRISPGQYHLMLTGPLRALQAGDIVAIHLNFERAGNLTVMAQVRDY